MKEKTTGRVFCYTRTGNMAVLTALMNKYTVEPKHSLLDKQGSDKALQFLLDSTPYNSVMFKGDTLYIHSMSDLGTTYLEMLTNMYTALKVKGIKLIVDDLACSDATAQFIYAALMYTCDNDLCAKIQGKVTAAPVFTRATLEQFSSLHAQGKLNAYYTSMANARAISAPYPKNWEEQVKLLYKKKTTYRAVSEESGYALSTIHRMYHHYLELLGKEGCN